MKARETHETFSIELILKVEGRFVTAVGNSSFIFLEKNKRIADKITLTALRREHLEKESKIPTARNNPTR